MVKKAFLAVFGLALVLAFAAPQKASAQVSIGVAIGTPVYVHPVRPYVYPAPVVVPRPYVYPRAYLYSPVVYGRYDRRPYWRHERFERREYWEHRRHHGRR